MPESITVSCVFPHVTAERLFRAWLDSAAHSTMTGGKAAIDPRPGGAFTAWGGYIQGTTLEVHPFRRIIQSWRTTEFPADSPDSLLEILFEDTPDRVKCTLIHSHIPDGQGEDYRRGWEDYYFIPMRGYFSETGKQE